MIWLVATTLIMLHTLDGREIDIHPAHVNSMREAKPDSADDKAFTSGVRCMINTTDGKFVNVVETCAEVRQKLEEAR